MSNCDWRIAAILFALISSIYFATIAGITSSNDGSHYALVRALVDKRSFEISEYLSFTENQDYALNGELRFSDRPPGTAALVAPIYALAQFLPPPLTTLHSKHDPNNPRLLYALIVPVVAASATAIILFWLLRSYFGLTEWVSIFTTLAFAFGTMMWKYGSLLYSHAASGLCVMLAIALVLKMSFRAKRGISKVAVEIPRGEAPARNDTSRVPIKNEQTQIDWRNNLLLGIIVGASVLMEYTNIVFVAFVGIWYVGQFATRSVPYKKQLIWFALGGLIPAALLMTYNTINFDGPLELSTFHVDTTRWPQNTSFFHDFATPIWIGLPAMLFWGSDNQGLFWLAPISLIGLLGLKPLWQKSRREFILIVGGFVAMLLLFSTSTTFNPLTNDGRYIAPFLGLWFVVVGLGVGAIRPLSASPLRWLIIYGLLFFSIQNQLWHIAFAWGHELKPEHLRPWAAAPDNLLIIFNAVFPNFLNLPLWWGLLAVGWMVGAIWRYRKPS